MTTTTVGIPLHRSRRWLDRVAANIDELADVAHVVVSDPDEHDDTLALLRARFGDRAEWQGRRELAPGWVAHANDLLAGAGTPLFMWLPHDDGITREWIVRAEAALADDPAALLAVGRVRAHDIDVPPPFAFDPGFAAADAETRVRAALDAFRIDASRLGLLFRAVFRTADAVALPPTTDDGWADVPWAIRMLSAGRAVEIDAVYDKRWHPASASANWAPMRTAPRLRSEWFPWAVALPDDRRVALLAEAWEREVRDLEVGYAGHVAHLDDRIRELRESDSWRLTRPLRALGRRLRRR